MKYCNRLVISVADQSPCHDKDGEHFQIAQKTNACSELVVMKRILKLTGAHDLPRAYLVRTSETTHRHQNDQKIKAAKYLARERPQVPGASLTYLLPVFINLTVHARFVLFLLPVFGRGNRAQKKTKNILRKQFCKNKIWQTRCECLKIFCFAFCYYDGKFYYCEMISSGRAKRQRCSFSSTNTTQW
jgi:hypothetical protein